MNKKINTIDIRDKRNTRCIDKSKPMMYVSYILKLCTIYTTTKGMNWTKQPISNVRSSMISKS